MKKTAFLLTLTIFCASLTACMDIPEIPSISAGHDTSQRELFNAQSSIFHSLEVNGESDVISADLDVYLAETEASFLFLEASGDTSATLHYSYTTFDQGGVQLGYGPDSGSDQTVLPLTAATEQTLGAFWFDEEITLHQGMNRLYLTGEKQNCKMRLEVRGADRDKLTYISGFPKRTD